VEVLLKVIGFFGQSLFAGRVVYQWFASERAGRAVVPRGYWGLSLAGGLLVLTYAIASTNPDSGERGNLVFAMSVLPGAVIAWKNMRIRRVSSRRELAPWGIALLGLVVWATWERPHVGTLLWATIGLSGSLLWSLRHLFQWWISERIGVPTLPLSFYLLSLAGSLLLLAYALYMRDIVMIAGYLFNFIPYLRILFLLRARVAGNS